MPTYGYRCTECKNEFERFQKMTDPPITECPDCGGPVKKLLYPVGIQFKGDGFYVNDYAKTDKKKAASASTEGGDTKSDATESKTEKTETKSETSTTPTPAASVASTSSDTK